MQFDDHMDPASDGSLQTYQMLNAALRRLLSDTLDAAPKNEHGTDNPRHCMAAALALAEVLGVAQGVCDATTVLAVGGGVLTPAQAKESQQSVTDSCEHARSFSRDATRLRAKEELRGGGLL